MTSAVQQQQPPPASSPSLSSTPPITAPARPLWLSAYSDPVASAIALPSSVLTCDLDGNGQYALVIGTIDHKLKVYRNTSLTTELPLIDVPVAVTAFYADTSAPPSIAVAAGQCVYIYRNMKPYFKLTLPNIAVDSAEMDVWMQRRSGAVTNAALVTALANIRESGITLSERSRIILGMEDGGAEQTALIDSLAPQPIVQLTVATVMSALHKSSDDERALSQLVVGTEHNQLHIMDVSGSNVLRTVLLPSTPALLAVSGCYDSEWRIIAACRNGTIYSIKNGKLMAATIASETPVVGIAMMDKTIYVATMDNFVSVYNLKARKTYSLQQPDNIAAIELLDVRRTKTVRALIVALTSGELRIYNKKTLIHTTSTGAPINVVRFAQYGREESSLITLSRSGAIDIKMLSRHANLDAPADGSISGETEVPFSVPKKSKAYVDHCSRERDECVEMHRIFQRDLCQLRLTTARTFVKVIMEGAAPISNVGGTSLKLTVAVSGLGPVFVIRIRIRNTGQRIIGDIPLNLIYDESVYQLKRPLTRVPCIVPGLEYHCSVPVECIDPSGRAQPIRVYVCHPKSSIPAISAVVNMPTSQMT